jgi:hypothetical protein
MPPLNLGLNCDRRAKSAACKTQLFKEGDINMPILFWDKVLIA